MEKTLGFIGAGNMATAIINGLLRNQVIPANMISVFDVNSAQQEIMKGRGVNTVKSACDLVANSEIIVLAVKPQNYEEVLTEIKDVVTQEKIFVSIAAGISISYVQSMVQCKCPMVRVMPNTPLLLGKGATALCPSENIGDEDFMYIKKIFSLNGVVEVFSENHMNEIIAVNGSSPAYIYLFAKAMADYAQDCGINKESALNLIVATLEGSAAMLRDSGDDPDILIKKVSSPGGTTISALNTLEEYKFYEGIKEAMKSCTTRAEELGK